MAATPPISKTSTRYKDDPSSVDGEWKTFFDGLKDDSADVKKKPPAPS